VCWVWRVNGTQVDRYWLPFTVNNLSIYYWNQDCTHSWKYFEIGHSEQKNMLFSILYKLNYNYVYNEPIFLACLITKLSLIKPLMCGNYSPLLCRCAILFVIFIQFLFHAILLFTDPYRSIKLLHSCQLWNVNF